MILAKRAAQVTAIASHRQDIPSWMKSSERLFLDGIDRHRRKTAIICTDNAPAPVFPATAAPGLPLLQHTMMRTKPAYRSHLLLTSQYIFPAIHHPETTTPKSCRICTRCDSFLHFTCCKFFSTHSVYPPLSEYLTGIAIKQANDIFPSALIRLVDFRQHAFDITGGIIFELTRLTIKQLPRLFDDISGSILDRRYGRHRVIVPTGYLVQFFHSHFFHSFCHFNRPLCNILF